MELERHRYQKHASITFKPVIDSRYAIDQIVTHSGWKHPALCVSSGADVLQSILDAGENPDVVAVDEAFMIPGIAEALIFLYRSGYTIIVSTLDMAFNGKPFPEVTKMLPWATRIEKLAAVCTVCGADAHYTHRKVLSDSDRSDDVLVGGEELYEPRCVKCHPHILNHELTVNRMASK